MVHTTGGSEKPTEESARERDLGVEVGRDSRYGSIYVCPPSPPRDPAPRCSPLSSSSLLLSLPDPTPSIRPTGLRRGTQGPPGASSAGHLIGRPAQRCAGGDGSTRRQRCVAKPKNSSLLNYNMGVYSRASSYIGDSNLSLIRLTHYVPFVPRNLLYRLPRK